MKKNGGKRKLYFEDKSVQNSSKQRKLSNKLLETDETSDESDIPLKELCDDDELDDIEVDLADKNKEVCFYCDGGGRDKELWYRCFLFSVDCGHTLTVVVRIAQKIMSVIDVQEIKKGRKMKKEKINE